MALFGLIDDKFCSICGGKIGLLGNRKLDDGNLCKDCANELSPWLVGRRSMTVGDIRAHLDYRAQNRGYVDAFTPTRVLGRQMKIYIDDNQGLLFFSRSQNWRNENPDILRFDQITGCTYEIKEYEHQEAMADDMPPPPPPGRPVPPPPGRPAPGRPVPPPPGRPAPGRPVPPQPGRPAPGRPVPPQPGRPAPGRPVPPQPGRPAPGRPVPPQPGRPAPGRPVPPQPGRPAPGRPVPPPGRPGGRQVPPPPQAARAPMPPTRVAAVGQRWYSYDFKMTVYVNSEWFQEIHFDVNSSSVRDQGSAEYNSCLYEAEEIRNTLLSINQGAVAGGAGGYGGYGYRVEAVTCPWCGATTMPNENNCCEYCGGTLAGRP